MKAIIRNLEVQLWQLSNAMLNRSLGALPSNMEQNPREPKVVTLRSGKTLEKDEETPKLDLEETKADNNKEAHKQTDTKNST